MELIVCTSPLFLQLLNEMNCVTRLVKRLVRGRHSMSSTGYSYISVFKTVFFVATFNQFRLLLKFIDLLHASDST